MNEQQSKTTKTTENDITTSTAPEPVIETNLTESDTSAAKKALVRNYAIATIIVALMGGGLWLVLESQGRVQTNFLGVMADRSPAATVNGVEISREAYERNRSQIEESAAGQEVDISDPTVISEINTQAIETLINTELLQQEAQKLGIETSQEDVQNRYNEIVQQVGGEEALTTRMAELGITEDGLRSDIEREMVIQLLFAQEANTASIEVTEEELREVYEQVSAQQEGELPFAEIREALETNIRLSKEQELVTAYIEKLRSAASVEITI